MRNLFLAIVVFVLMVPCLVLWRWPFGADSGAIAAGQQIPVRRSIRTGADEATLAARKSTNKLIRFSVRNEEDREAALMNGTLIEDYGSFIVVAMNEKGTRNTRKLNPVSKAADSDVIDTSINLRGRSFDPLKDKLSKATASANKLLQEPATAGGYYIVQFAAPVRDQWLDEIRAAGAEVLQYVPNQAFFVYATPEAMATISEHPRVRWTGDFLPSDKLSPEMSQLLSRSQGGNSEKRLFDLVVFAKADLNLASATVADFGATILHRIILPNNYFNVLRVEMEPGLALPMLQIPGVISIDPYITPTAEDERSSQIMAGNFTSSTQLNSPGYDSLSQFGVDGTGVTVAVIDDGIAIPGDGGFYITSSNAANGPMRGTAPGIVSGHGHLNATIIGGDLPFSTLDPLGYNYGMGVARKAHLLNIPMLIPGYTGTEADTCNDTVTTAGPNGIKGFISNNSWGSGTNGNAYDSLAAQYDGFVRDSSAAATIDPLVIVFSAGNQSTSGLTRPKMSKNTIAVASSKNIRPELSASANNLNDLSSFSSRGPAADGRIKPDITAPGEAITGGRAGLSPLYGNIDDFHRWSSGTSHAAPQIAGAAALFTQYWKTNNSGNNPSPALVKAALISGTQDMTGTGASAAIPNGNEGWGRLNLQNMLNTGVATKYVNQTTTLSSVGEEVIYTGTVSTTSRHFRVSLVWTDPPGATDPALVNNLDLEVNVGGTIYKGNVFAGGISTTGGAADIRNNVENVFLPSGIEAGTAVTIRIRATGLNGDGVLGNGDSTDQHFALVAFNFNEGAGVCNYSVNPGSQSFPLAGGNGTVTVTAGPGCAWSVVSNDNWIIPVENGGTGNGVVNYTVQAFAGQQRTGSLTVAGQTFTVNQSMSFVVRKSDFDGDGKTDFSTWRGADTFWRIIRSSDSQPQNQAWGSGNAPYNDLPVPGDYDGDGKTDFAVWRPSDGNWYVIRSSNGSFFWKAWGTNGDIPVPGDYDGDGKTDLAVWRGQEGNWYILRSSDNQFQVRNWGLQSTPFNDIPVAADYDGDGKTDIAVFRSSDSTWYVVRSSNNSIQIQPFGLGTDIPVPGDYDGDGKYDFATWRGADNNWRILQSSNSQISITNWGVQAAPFNDVAVPGDYDGDGRYDIAVFRRSDATWYVIRSSNGQFLIQTHGQGGDTPVPSTGVR
ncbi:MAG: S8 family serine peptidase [Blastocatellales bacterium]